MEKRLINLESSEKVLEMEYAYMYTISNRISKESGIHNTEYVMHEVLDILNKKNWVSDDLHEFGKEQMGNGIYPRLVNERSGMVDVFVDMLKCEIKLPAMVI